VNVVFDLGGVVLTWDPGSIIASIFADEREQALVRRCVFGDPDWVSLDRGMLSLEDAIVRASQRTGISASRLHTLFEAVPIALVPVEPVLELVSEVRLGGSGLYVLSNLHRASFERVRDELGVFELFDGRIVSCEVAAAKPEPAIYERLLGDFGLDPASTVFIDDHQVNLDAAAQLGIATILFTDTQRCRAELRALGVPVSGVSHV
jgi:HAD superfamily hydrolase (TIGR01509 family)